MWSQSAVKDTTAVLSFCNKYPLFALTLCVCSFVSSRKHSELLVFLSGLQHAGLEESRCSLHHSDQRYPVSPELLYLWDENVCLLESSPLQLHRIHFSDHWQNDRWPIRALNNCIHIFFCLPMCFCRPFSVSLENSHVIGRDQIFVSVIEHGPDRVPLSSAFNRRSVRTYIVSSSTRHVHCTCLIYDLLGDWETSCWQGWIFLSFF